MGDIDKLKITIDRDECIGDGLCVNEAPETFEMDDDSKAITLEGSTESRDTIIEAARSCPVDAIKIVDADSGEQLAPEE